MKRLFPLLFSLALVGAITGTPTVQAQSISKAAEGSFFPIARNDTVLISINTTVDIDVLANDEDTNPGAVIFLEDDFILEPDHGTATVERSGTGNDFIRYEPDEDFGSDRARITIHFNINHVFGRRSTIRLADVE